MQVYGSTSADARLRAPGLLVALALGACLTSASDAQARPIPSSPSAHLDAPPLDHTPRPDVGQVRFEQRSRRGGSSGGGQAVPRGGSGGGSGSGGSSGGGRSSGGSSGGSGSSGPTTGSPRTRSGSGADGSTGTATARPRDGRPSEGTAVERRDGSGPSGGDRDRDRTVVVGGGYYGGFYPWGWGGLGLGGYYGYYDPWGWGGYDPYGPYGPSRRYWSGNEGSLRLRVTPRQAEVFVDGYFAGAVDDYDGTFQRLRLEPGPHRIEVRLDGYEPLSFEVRIPPGRTVTFRGTLDRDNRDDRDDRDDR